MPCLGPCKGCLNAAYPLRIQNYNIFKVNEVIKSCITVRYYYGFNSMSIGLPSSALDNCI